MVPTLRAILTAVAKTWGLEPASHLATARRAWPQVVGPALAATSMPVRFRAGRLSIGVTHSATGGEIRLRRGEIVRALNLELGKDAVVDVIPISRRDLGLPGRRATRRTP